MDLREWVEGVPGFSNAENLAALYEVARGTEGDLLEVGTWCGRSAVVLGLVARERGRKLVCVDLFPRRGDWRRVGERWAIGDGEAGFSDEVYRKQVLPIYEGYDSPMEVAAECLKARGLEAELIRGTSDVVDGEFGFAFIDGAHDYEGVCRDIENVLPKVSGVVAFDDAFHVGYPGVLRAVLDKVFPVARKVKMINPKMCAAWV